MSKVIKTLDVADGLLVGCTDGEVATSDVADDAVTYAKMQNVSATQRLLGRQTAGAGNIEEIAALSVDANANVVVSTAALATNATDGFLYIPTCAGTPTGTPTTLTGRVPIIFDTTNDKLYVYRGGWKSVTLA